MDQHRKYIGSTSLQDINGQQVGVTDNALDVNVVGGDIIIDNVSINVQTDAFGATPDSMLFVGSDDGTETGNRSVVVVNNDSVLKTDGSDYIQPISGALTDAELRATAVPISAASLPLPLNAAQEHTTAASPSAVRLTDGATFYKATTPADTQPISGTVIARDYAQSIIVDEFSNTVTYIGKATSGSATSAAVWQISKLEASGTVTSLKFADGTTDFDNIWDDRASLTYS